jgi:2,4-dienoyl-CoA reductase-like NADH-dependent reductase (Old Yellow Enzyme family)
LEDPLIEVAKHIEIVRKVKELRPQMVTVGSGLTYLQEWFPQVAQALVRNNQMDFAGMGRMVLAYPEMYRDILMGNELQKKKICRTFSDCTTAPRKGLVSGCYPLDAFYKGLPEWAKLKELK